MQLHNAFDLNDELVESIIADIFLEGSLETAQVGQKEGICVVLHAKDELEAIPVV